jgi:hypothetical protein
VSLATEIAAILTEPLVVRINFSLSGLSITGAGFGRVKSAIAGGTIRIVTDPDLPPETGGKYYASTNELGVEPSLTPRGLSSSVQMRAVMLHECSHALVDLSHASATTILTDESAAYIAQLIYRLGWGQNYLRTWARGSRTPTGRVFREAIRIIDRFELLRSAARLCRQDFNSLREAVRLHPLYRGTSRTALTTADG